MRVRYTLTAARQIEASLDYLAARSQQAAQGLQARIQSVIALLQMHPHAGRATSIRHIRRIPIGVYPYVLDYAATENEIVVRRFRHASQRPLP